MRNKLLAVGSILTLVLGLVVLHKQHTNEIVPLGSPSVLGESQLPVNKSPFIRLYDKNNEFECTGFVIDDNYAITAAHCVPSDLRTVEKTLPIKVVRVNYRMDQALLMGDFRTFDKLNKLYQGSIQDFKGAGLLTCGFPGGQSEVLCTKALVIGYHNFFILASGELYPGMSGGPVIYMSENGPIVVGVNSSSYGDTDKKENTDYVLLASLVGFTGFFQE